MLKLKSIELNNIVIYDEAYFEFQRGVSLINGSNGSGKSLIFSLLSNIFYDAHPLTGKKDNSINNGTIKLSFNINSDDYILIYNYNKSLKIKILKNGEDLQFETLTEAREYLDTLKIKEGLFFVSVYLTSYRPHPLLFGNFTSRFDFFESLFDLSKVDELLDQVKKQIRSLEDTKIKKETLEQEILQIDKQLTSVNEDQLNQRKTLLEQELKNFKEDNIKKSKLLDSLNILEKQLQKIQKLEASTKNIKKPDNSLSILKELKYKNIIEEPNNTYFVDILTRSQNLINKLESLKQKLLDLDEIQKKIAKTDIELNTYKNKLKEISNTEDLTEIRQELLTSISVLQTTLNSRKSLITKKDQCRCDKCGSLISIEVLTKEVSDLESQLKTKKEEYIKIDTQYNNFNKLTKTIENINNTKSNLDVENKNTKTSLDLLADKLKLSSFEILLNLSENLNNSFIDKIINQLNILAEAANEDIKIINQQQDIIKLNTLKEEYKDTINNLNIIADKTTLFDINSIQNQKQSLQKEISEGLDTEYRLDKEIQNIVLDLNIIKHNKQRKEEIQLTLQKINEEIINISYYKILEEILGPNGFKKYKMKYNIKKFESLLNKYSSFLFDNIKFELILEKRTLQINALRNGISSDVNKLSGSEGRRFCLLILIATLSLIDSKNRCDTLILDEMDNGLDENFKNKFYNSFLPEIQKIIPKIVIITPDSDINTSYPIRRYIVQKERDKSRIIEV